MLCCDWILECRGEIWEIFSGGKITATPAQLTAFQNDLNSLKKIAQNLPVCIKTILTIEYDCIDFNFTYLQTLVGNAACYGTICRFESYCWCRTKSHSAIIK